MSPEHTELDTKPLFERLMSPVDPERAEAVVGRSVQVAARRRRVRRALVAAPLALVLIALGLVVAGTRDGAQRVRVADGPRSTSAPDDTAVVVEVSRGASSEVIAGVVLGPELVVVPLDPLAQADRVAVRDGAALRKAQVVASSAHSYLGVLHVAGLARQRAPLAAPTTEPGTGATLLVVDPGSLATRRVPVSLNPRTEATERFMAGLLGIRSDPGGGLPVALLDAQDRVVALPVGTAEGELVATRSFELWMLLSNAAGEGHAGVELGRAHPFTFSLHCGFGPVRFNGRWWQPVGAPPARVPIRQPEATGRAVPLVEYVVGEAWLSAADELVFTAANTVDPLEVRYEPTTPPKYECA